MDADQLEFDDWLAVDAVLAADSSRVALRGADGTTLTRAALSERISAIRESLASLGLGPSHRVATVLPTEIETAIALLALMGRVNLMPLNPGATPMQWADQMAAGGVDAVIVPEGTTPALPDHVPLYRLADRLVGPTAPTPQQTRVAGLVLQTSGSTGTPKRVPLSTGQLVASARNIARHLTLGPDDVAIHALPMFHVGAVVDLLAAPLLAGGSVIVARDLSAEALRETMAVGGTWLQLVPTALGHLLEGDVPGHDLRFVRMVSADLSADLQARAEVALGVPIIQMYGMTETAGQIASNPLPPGQAKPLSVGVPAGPEVAIIDAHGARLPIGKDGEVCVRGATVMAGYEGSDATPRFGQWLRTGDLGHLDEDGYLFLTGRVKELINRGGEKISPLTVERAAKAVPGVQDAVAYALSHQTLGEHVGLTVVADEGVTEEAVLAALSSNLADHEQPRRVQFASTLPKLPSGKVDRRGVALAGREETPASGERAGVARVASKRWAEVLSVRPPHDDADFFDDGGDSLSATDFLIALETDLGRQVSPNLLFDAPRFGALVAQLEAVPQVEDDAAGEPEWMSFLRRRIAGWMGQRVGPSGLLVARNTVQEGTKIFYADHSDRNQAALGRAAGTGHPVYMVSTMRGYGEDHHAFFPELAAIYAGEITAILAPGEPVILSGYCGGGLLMAHIAPLLIAAGHTIDVFVAFDVPFEAPTPYPVLHIGSVNAEYSAPARYPWPERAAHVDHPAGVTYLFWRTYHRRLVSEKLLTRHAAKVDAYLAKTKRPERHAATEDLTPEGRKARWSARLSYRTPLRLHDKTPTPVTVQVTNTSGQTWPPTETSGLFITADFFTRGWRPIRFRAPWVALDRAVAPGETITVTMDLVWPHVGRKGPFRLKIRMGDSGFGHFGARRFDGLRPGWLRDKVYRRPAR